MSEEPPADTAFRVADRMSADPPWDVFAERVRRYEIHLNGRSVEMTRGPIELEGYGLRVLRPREGKVGSGFQASTDLTDAGVRTALADAETIARHAAFPAKSVELPAESRSHAAPVEVRDRRLWDRPMDSLDDYVAALLAAFDGVTDVVPSFGSVRATLVEATIANSQGIRQSFAHTKVEFEIAVKAFGGPEGVPPGEYWVNDNTRRLEPERLPAEVERWCGFARDVRRAKPTPAGARAVVLPPSVLSGIFPIVFGSRFTGDARLREIAPTAGAVLGPPELSIRDDGRVPWAVGSAPVDDEGTAQRSRTLLSHGAVAELLYDSLRGAAFGLPSSGNAVREAPGGFHDWRRFLHRPIATSTTVVIEPGTGGSDREVIEAAGDGIWVQQLGWAYPDPVSTAFGGEVRIGYRIRGGKLAEPVRGGTVGGFVLAPPGQPSMLSTIGTLGSDAELSEGVLTPTVLVKGLTVAGAGPSGS